MHCDVAKQILLSYDTLQLCISCGGFITVDCQWRWLLLNHSINDSNYGPTHLPLLAVLTHIYVVALVTKVMYPWRKCLSIKQCDQVFFLCQVDFTNSHHGLGGI